MKRNFKKIASLLIVLAMILTSIVTAFSAYADVTEITEPNSSGVIISNDFENSNWSYGDVQHNGATSEVATNATLGSNALKVSPNANSSASMFILTDNQGRPYRAPVGATEYNVSFDYTCGSFDAGINANWRVSLTYVKSLSDLTRCANTAKAMQINSYGSGKSSVATTVTIDSNDSSRKDTTTTPYLAVSIASDNRSGKAFTIDNIQISAVIEDITGPDTNGNIIGNDFENDYWHFGNISNTDASVDVDNTSGSLSNSNALKVAPTGTYSVSTFILTDNQGRPYRAPIGGMSYDVTFDYACGSFDAGANASWKVSLTYVKSLSDLTRCSNSAQAMLINSYGGGKSSVSTTVTIDTNESPNGSTTTPYLAVSIVSNNRNNSKTFYIDNIQVSLPVVETYETFTESYDEYTDSTISGQFSAQSASTTLSIENDTDHGNYLNIEKTGNDTYTPNYIIKNTDDTTLKQVLTSNKTYNVIVRFKYQINSASNEWGLVLKPALFSADFTQLTTRGKSILLHRKDYGGVSDNPADTMINNNMYGSYLCNPDGEWHEAAIGMQITANSGSKASYPGFYFDGGDRKYNVSFDDVEFEIHNTDEPVSTLYFKETSDDYPVDAVAGVVGTTYDITDTEADFTYDAPQGIVFEGYYLDSQYENIWDGKFQVSDATLYTYYTSEGGPKSVTENFEQYDSTTIQNNFGDTDANHGVVTIDTENSNKFLHYTVNGNSRTNQFRPSFVITNSDGYGLQQGFMKGVKYSAIVSLKYKINDARDEWGVVLKPQLLNDDLSAIVTSSAKSTFRLSRANPTANGYCAGIYDGNWHTASFAVDFTVNRNVFADFGFQFDAGDRIVDVCLDDISVCFQEKGVEVSTVGFGSYNKIDIVAGVVGTSIPSSKVNSLATNIYARGKIFTGYTLDGIAFDGKFPETSGDITATFRELASMYDFNDDKSVNILDLVKLKKNIANEKGYIVSGLNPSDLLTELVKTLISLEVNKTFDGISGNYVLAWNDEFDTLNSEDWNIATDEHNQEITYETNVVGSKKTETFSVKHSADNVNINNGVLEISTSIDKSNKIITGGEIDSKFKTSLKYGYVEARIKLQADGNKSGFWLNGSGLASPNIHSEIDILENFDSQTSYMSDIHYWNGTKASSDEGYTKDFGDVIGNTRIVTNLSAGWHTFGALITPDVVKFYLDGNCYCQTTFAALNAAVADLGFDDVMDCPLYFIIGSIVSTDYYEYSLWNAIINNTAAPFCVDYVRVYQNPNTDTFNY